MFGLRILCLCLIANSLLPLIANAQGADHAQVVGDCVALEFVRSGCSHCRAMDQTVDESLRHGWAARRIEVNDDPFTTKRWRIHSTPTTLLVRDGREVDRILGPVTFDELQRRMMAASSRITGNSTDSTISAPPNPGIVPTSASFSLQPIAKQSDSQPMSFEPDPSSPSSPSPSLSTSPNTAANARDAAEIARRATVRIRVDEPNTQAFGTGTIIHAYREDALIITCGHLFRGVSPNPSITVELFDGGQAIAYPASLVHYEAGDKDIGLIAFRPGRPVACAPIATSKRLIEGDYVFSIGCDHGNDPSRRNSRITKLNRYLGPANIEVAGTPVQGRSGGGLFTQAGELIGICYAADQELDEGLYAGLELIHEQVAKLGLESLPQTPPPTPRNAVADRLNNHRSNNHLSQSITLIVRDGDGNQREMKIQDPSPALLQALAREGYAIAP